MYNGLLILSIFDRTRIVFPWVKAVGVLLVTSFVVDVPALVLLVIVLVDDDAPSVPSSTVVEGVNQVWSNHFILGNLGISKVQYFCEWTS